MGRIRVTFPEAAPRAGAMLIASGTTRALPRVALPGEATERWAAARANVSHRFTVRDFLATGIDRVASPASGLVHGGLIAAMAGQPGALVPDAERDLLRRTGTWHLIAVSGLQVGLVAGVAWWAVGMLCRPLALFWPYGGLRWPAAFGAAVAAFAFTHAAGSPPSAVRAAILASAAGICRAAGVSLGAWEGLALALCGTLVLDPSAVDHLGFQLSFSAIAGILLWSHRVTRWVPPDAPWLVRTLASSIGATLGATFGTLPVIAWTFQTLSPLSPLTNLLAGPLLGALATPAAVAGFALSDTSSALSAVAFTLADNATDLALQVLAPLDVDPWHPAVGPGGALLLVFAALVPRRPWLVMILLIVALGMRWPVPPIDGRLVVQFLAIGQGDGAIVTFPDGKVWVVDAGPSAEGMLETLRRQGVRHLDRVIVSHPHPDHYGGIEALLANLQVDALVVPRAPRSGEAEFAALLGLADRVSFAELPKPATLLHPMLGWTGTSRDPVNDESLVFRLTFGGRRFLFTGDIEREGEAELLTERPRELAADVLKVAHHGSRTSSSWPFVTAVNPSVAVISCGEDNRFRHPNPEALAHLRGRKVYRTDRDGTVVVTTDGRDLRVDLPDRPE